MVASDKLTACQPASTGRQSSVRRTREALIRLFGTLNYDANYDYRKDRRAREIRLEHQRPAGKRS